MKKFSAVLWAIASLCFLSLRASGQEPPRYTLSVFSGFATGHAMNNAGTIAATYGSGFLASQLTFSTSSSSVSLWDWRANTIPFAISLSGKMAGCYALNGIPQPVMWENPFNPTSLPLPSGYIQGIAYGLQGSTAVGYISNNLGLKSLPATWVKKKYIPLNTSRLYPYGVAHGISSNAAAISGELGDGILRKATIWRQGYPFFLFSHYQNSVAYSCTNTGQCVGKGWVNSPTQSVPLLWDSDFLINYELPLPNFWHSGEAHSATPTVVVGSGKDQFGNFFGIIWWDRQVYTANELCDGNTAWTVVDCISINFSGNVLVKVRSTVNSTIYATGVLTPSP